MTGDEALKLLRGAPTPMGDRNRRRDEMDAKRDSSDANRTLLGGVARRAGSRVTCKPRPGRRTPRAGADPSGVEPGGRRRREAWWSW